MTPPDESGVDRYRTRHDSPERVIVVDHGANGKGYRAMCVCARPEDANRIISCLTSKQGAEILTDDMRRFIERVLLRNTAGPDRRYAETIVACLTTTGEQR